MMMPRKLPTFFLNLILMITFKLKARNFRIYRKYKDLMYFNYLTYTLLILYIPFLYIPEILYTPDSLLFFRNPILL